MATNDNTPNTPKQKITVTPGPGRGQPVPARKLPKISLQKGAVTPKADTENLKPVPPPPIKSQTTRIKLPADLQIKAPLRPMPGAPTGAIPPAPGADAVRDAAMNATARILIDQEVVRSPGAVVIPSATEVTGKTIRIDPAQVKVGPEAGETAAALSGTASISGATVKLDLSTIKPVAPTTQIDPALVSSAKTRPEIPSAKDKSTSQTMRIDLSSLSSSTAKLASGPVPATETTRIKLPEGMTQKVVPTAMKATTPISSAAPVAVPVARAVAPAVPPATPVAKAPEPPKAVPVAAPAATSPVTPVAKAPEPPKAVPVAAPTVPPATPVAKAPEPPKAVPVAAPAATSPVTPVAKAPEPPKAVPVAAPAATSPVTPVAKAPEPPKAVPVAKAPEAGVTPAIPAPPKPKREPIQMVVKPVWPGVRKEESRPATPAVAAPKPVEAVKPPEPVAPPKPVEAVKPPEPVAPPKPVEAAKPPEPVAPAKPVEAAKPPEPVAPAKPVEAAKPPEPVAPAKPVEAAKPPEPVAPPKPVEAVKPPEPVAPPKPVEAVKPPEPVAPPKPVEAVKPPEPVAPPKPVEAFKPPEPVAPPKPVEAAKPPEPVAPPKPVEAAKPPAPAAPAEPPRPRTIQIRRPSAGGMIPPVRPVGAPKSAEPPKREEAILTPPPVDQLATTVAINLPVEAETAAPPTQVTAPAAPAPDSDIFLKATMALDAEKIAAEAAEIPAEEGAAPRPKTIMIKRPTSVTSATAKTVKTLRPPEQDSMIAKTASGVKTIKLSRPGAPEGIPSHKKSSTSKVDLPEDLMTPEESGSRKRTVKIKRPGGAQIAPSVTTDAAAMSDGKLQAAGRTFDFQPVVATGAINIAWTILSVLGFLVAAFALWVVLATAMPDQVPPPPGVDKFKMVDW
jgi:hypothetical protein